MPITNDVKFETLEPIDTSFYIGLLTGSSFTLIITSVFFMMKDQLEKRKRLIEMERIIKERDKMRSQLNNKMTFLSNRFRQTAETVTESRLVSDMLLLRENND